MSAGLVPAASRARAGKKPGGRAGLDFVSLGLVYDVEIEGSDVHITFTLTTPGCPIGPQVTEQMKEFVTEVEGVEKVFPKMVFTPPWSPEIGAPRRCCPLPAPVPDG